MKDTLDRTGGDSRSVSETIEKYLGSNDPELVPLLEQLALVYQAQEKFVEAETQYLRIFSIMRETEGDSDDDHPDKSSLGAAYAYKLLGGLYKEWGKHASAAGNAPEANEKKRLADENFTRAWKRYSAILGANSPQASIT